MYTHLRRRLVFHLQSIRRSRTSQRRRSQCHHIPLRTVRGLVQHTLKTKVAHLGSLSFQDHDLVGQLAATPSVARNAASPIGSRPLGNQVFRSLPVTPFSFYFTLLSTRLCGFKLSPFCRFAHSKEIRLHSSWTHSHSLTKSLASVIFVQPSTASQ